jgi:hypothetical protein
VEVRTFAGSLSPASSGSTGRPVLGPPNEKEQSMKRLAAIAVIAIVAAFPTAAFAGQPDNAECFGVGASQLAQSSTGAMGSHSSSFDEPRLGIGNVAELFTGTKQPGNLGVALGADC